MSRSKKDLQSRVLARNRQASHYYHFLEQFEVGIELTGTEVKSIREGKASLRESYAAIKNEQAWLYNCHVTPYPPAGKLNHEALRVKRLLMHKREILPLDRPHSREGSDAHSPPTLPEKKPHQVRVGPGQG